MPFKSRRGHHRRCHELFITFSDYNSDELHDAMMNNQSSEGMCFNTCRSLQPGADIYVNIPRQQSEKTQPATDIIQRARVRWCTKKDNTTYSIGVKYSEPLIKQISKKRFSTNMPSGFWEMDSTDFS